MDSSQRVYRVAVQPFVWIGLILALDQLTKWAFSLLLSRGSISIIDGVVRLTLAYNPGGAFGILAGQGELLTLLTIGVVAVILVMLWKGRVQATVLAVGLSAVAGGALGNLIDRLRLGYVVDFLDIGLSPALRWPTFNLADASIVLGTGLLLWHLLAQEARS
jgi:signal peptidase II